ncbi:MAG: hypothetical protein LBV47_03090, partial [Bacteroidales bacterium]|nr:hypothetical protein [Bacteroidales bacterium]
LFTVNSCKDPDSIFKDTEIQEPVTRSGESGWDYPVKPGTGAWNALKTEEERIAAVQVPETILASLSPDDAVRLCITLPAFFIFTAWNTPQEGFEVMLSRYNILKHILDRKDAGGSLIAAYKDAGMSGFKTLPYSNEFWTTKLDYLELLLFQEEILQSMTPDQRVELIVEARLKFAEKSVNEAFASIPGILPPLCIMASVLHIEEYPEFITSPNRQAINQLIQTGWLFDDISSIDEIIKITDNYINTKQETP